MQSHVEVVLATCVVVYCPKLQISPFVASGELHVVLARRAIFNQRYDRAAMSCKGSIARMREQLLYGGLGMLTREVLVNIGLVEGPEIDGLVAFEISDSDQIAFADHEPFACPRRDVNSVSNSERSGHASPHLAELGR
jgi:hypothetical protein